MPLPGLLSLLPGSVLQGLIGISSPPKLLEDELSPSLKEMYSPSPPAPEISTSH